MIPLLAVGLSLLVRTAGAQEGEAAPVEAPAAPVEAPAAPVEAPPTASPPPGPTALQVWEHERLRLTEGSSGYTVGTLTHTYTAAELAALTGDADRLRSFATREGAARRESRVLLLAGALLATVGVAELAAVAGAEEGSTKAEDHLWRGTVVLAAGSVALAASPVPPQREELRRRDVTVGYTREEVDAQIAAYNERLRARLGLPAEAVAP